MPRINISSEDIFRKKFANYMAVGLAGMMLYFIGFGINKINKNYSFNRNKACVQNAIDSKNLEIAGGLLNLYKEKKGIRPEDEIRLGLEIRAAKNNRKAETDYLDSIKIAYESRFNRMNAKICNLEGKIQQAEQDAKKGTEKDGEKANLKKDFEELRNANRKVGTMLDSMAKHYAEESTGKANSLPNGVSVQYAEKTTGKMNVHRAERTYPLPDSIIAEIKQLVRDKYMYENSLIAMSPDDSRVKRLKWTIGNIDAKIQRLKTAKQPAFSANYGKTRNYDSKTDSFNNSYVSSLVEDLVNLKYLCKDTLNNSLRPSSVNRMEGKIYGIDAQISNLKRKYPVAELAENLMNIKCAYKDTLKGSYRPSSTKRMEKRISEIDVQLSNLRKTK